MKRLYEQIANEQPYCQLCGSTSMLHIHHIIYGKLYGSRNDLTYYENLIRLCNNCHLKVHKNKKYWIPVLQQIRKTS